MGTRATIWTSNPTVRVAGALGFVAVLLLAACSSGGHRVTAPSQPTSPSVPAATTTTPLTSGAGSPTPAASPEGKAFQLLDAVVVPPGSRQERSLPGRAFQGPWEGPRCTALVDESRLWKVAQEPDSVASYLSAHAPGWIPYNGTGQLSGLFTGTGLEGYPTGPGWSAPGSPYQLDVTVSPAGSGFTGIRADAQVVPPGATCDTKGGASPPGT